MKLLACIVCLVLSASLARAQQAAQQPSVPATPNYSGMYSFLKDGEFVQLTIEDGRVSGFISRYGDHETDRGVFLDHFFKTDKKDSNLDGNKLAFATRTVHNVWYEFKGTIERGQGKSVQDDGYYILKGTLVTHTQDASGKETTNIREVVFKSFPQDMGQ